jgi:hypothetical protein
MGTTVTPLTAAIGQNASDYERHTVGCDFRYDDSHLDPRTRPGTLPTLARIADACSK